MSAPFSFSLAVLACSSIRVIRAMCLTLALCVFGLISASEAWAGYPPDSYAQGAFTGYPTPTALCQAVIGSGNTPSLLETTSGTICMKNGQQNGYILGHCAVVGNYVQFNSTNLSTPCANSPPPTCSIAAGTPVSGSQFQATTSSPLAAGMKFCVKGSSCEVSASERTGRRNLTTGKWEYVFWGPLSTSGSACSGSTDEGGQTQPDQPIKCSAGMCTGTVNGVEICVKCVQADTSTAGTTTTTNPDGSKTEVGTATTTTVNNNNVTTTTVTTTTTTPAGGGTPTTQTKTDAKTESKDSFCASNPNDPLCKKSLDNQAGGGDDCNSPPTCSGDAIQCMMVSQQWRTRCNLEKQSSLSDLGNAVAAGNDPNASSNPALDTNRTTIDLSGKIDQSTFLSGGLLQDQVMGAGNGHTITLPLSKLNQYLVILGNVFVAIALIGAAKIVTGGT